MARTHLRVYLDVIREDLSPNRRIPRITHKEIDYNYEMMSVDDQDAAKLFLAGIITNIELVNILSGKRVLD